MAHEIFVPGRLCILGEHTDWAAEYSAESPIATNISGYAIVCTTNEGLYSRINHLPDLKLVFLSSDCRGMVRSFTAALAYSQLVESAQDPYFGYIAGTAAVIIERYGKRIDSGIEIENYKTTLPMGKGLSSSAAVAVTVAKAFNTLFDLHLSMEDIMELAYLGEMLTASRCGRMDQCVAMGADAIGLMEFQRSKCSVRVIPNAKTLYFVVADIGASKDTVVILRDLNNCFPVPKSATESLMHEYVVENVNISRNAVLAIEKGDLSDLARQMIAAQESFDRCAMPNCPSELAAPRLHSIINDDKLKAVSLAMKGVGSQGDGSLQILCDSEDNQRNVLQILQTLGCEGFILTIKGAL